jgi:hypothetical protein
MQISVGHNYAFSLLVFIGAWTQISRANDVLNCVCQPIYLQTQPSASTPNPPTSLVGLI